MSSTPLPWPPHLVEWFSSLFNASGKGQRQREGRKDRKGEKKRETQKENRRERKALSPRPGVLLEHRHCILAGLILCSSGRGRGFIVPF